jgi:alginate O-acetyltransferase complex protein AlgI
MLFNSFPFIFGFLPVVLAGFYTLGHWRRDWAISWLILASFFFYAWWRPLNVLLITPSILVNYVLARTIERLAGAGAKPRAASAVLVVGIIFNLCFLGYFKYVNFFGSVIGDVFGVDLVLAKIILPLGISFITFQKIAFLVDVHSGRVKSFTLGDYALFVLFFPQLVAGPIVHYREMMPQFHAAPCRFHAEDAAVGISLFAFGLFKKAVLADSIASFSSPIYADAAQGNPISLFYAWIAAIGFMLQVYFDFAGYSEMALGIARFFGIKLPMNFNSPLKAASVIEFWQRWHMTLTRFLTAYLYNPMTMALTRRRMAKGLPVAGGRNTSPSAFVTLVAFPTLVTFLVCGLWHGAGYQYVIWGFMHGVFLTINQGWRMVRRRYLPASKAELARALRPFGRALTFLSIVAAIVIFRAPTLGAAVDLWKGMVGLNGITVPEGIYGGAGALSVGLDAINATPDPSSGSKFLESWTWIAVLLFIAWALPNSLEMLRRHEPALGVAADAAPDDGRLPRLLWRPSFAWAAALAAMAFAGILSLGQLSEFLYWQF